MKTTIKHITAEMIGTEVTLSGWIQTIRSSGKIAFVELRDGTGYLQCIIELAVVGETSFDEIKECGIESAIQITGSIAKHPKHDSYELQTTSVEVISVSKDYPLGTKEHGPEFLFDNRHLYLRSKTQVAVMKIRDTICTATYEWMRNHDFTRIDAPIFTPNACEGTTELYEVEHVNGETMYLSQSGQLYIETAIAAHRNVYDFGPVFRAEKSKTRRHLNEFWMMDAEMAFCSFEENLAIQESLIKYIIQQVLTVNAADLVALDRDTTPLTKIVDAPWKRMTHEEFVSDLIAKGFDVQQGEDIGSDIEMQYMAMVDEPVFVTHFPMAIKAFYTKEDPDMSGYGLCADLLAPEGCGEVIGGAQRIDDYDTLLAKVHEHELDPAIFDRYLDIRKYGGVPHGGFGYGLERIVRWLCGLHHIRETIPFPRYANRIRP